MMKAEKRQACKGKRTGRDRILVGTLLILVIVWFATWPLRTHLNRETARLERDAAQKAEAAQAIAQQKALVAAARRRVAATPQDVEAHLALAGLLGQTHHYTEAIPEYQTALRLNPNLVEAHTALGESFDAAGMPDLAAEEYRRALDLDAGNTQALTLLGYKYVSFGWNRQAAALLDRAEKAQPDSARLQVTLGLVHFQNGDALVAERHLLAARRLAPDDPTILGPLIEVYRNAKRYPEALKTIDEAMKSLPDKPLLLLERAQVQLSMNDPRAALATADAILRADSGHLRARYIRATAEKMLGETAAAIRDLETVRAGDPHIGQTLFLLGQLYEQNGRQAEGAACLKEYDRNRQAEDEFTRLTLSVASQPNRADAHLALGRWYADAGNAPRAIVELKRALELEPKNGEAQRLLSAQLEKAGRRTEAQTVTAALSPQSSVSAATR